MYSDDYVAPHQAIETYASITTFINSSRFPSSQKHYSDYLAFMIQKYTLLIKKEQYFLV